MLKIIDNKRIDLTDDEWRLYESICGSYKQGKDLFRDLFETDENGIIVFLKPPKKMFSMEVVIYLQNIMLHQHLRKINNDNIEAMKEIKELTEKFKTILKEQSRS